MPAMKLHRSLSLAVLFLLGASALPAVEAQAHPHGPIPTAEELADRVINTLGGSAAWNETHYLRFTFAGRRTHLWDKHAGRDRVEGETKEGEKYVVVVDLQSKQGKVWLNGREASGEKAQKLLENAYGAWVNDTYWLVMPYKLRDPGVNLAYVGQESIDGATYDKLLLTFHNVGLTPGDRYWAFIHRETGLMDRWAYVLESEPDLPPTVWKWQGWQRYGKIMLAPDRVMVGEGDRKLPLSGIQVLETVPETAFTSPEPLPGS
jgi:hypothetical protein